MGLTLGLLAPVSWGVEAVRAQEPGACDSPNAGAWLDHVVVAVHDLMRATEEFEMLGFTAKPGRRHPNGLFNAHFKFQDGTELELMSVQEPTDDMATKYADFLGEGEGGAYLALGVGSAKSAASTLNRAGIEHQIQSGSAFNYVTFSEGSGLEHIFLFESLASVQDSPSLLTHANGTRGIIGLVIDEPAEEPNGPVRRLLGALGAVECRQPGMQRFLQLGRSRIFVSQVGAGRRGRVSRIFLLGLPSAKGRRHHVRGVDLEW